MRICCDGDALAFAAPQLRRSAPLLPEQLDRVVTALQVAPEDVVDPDQRRLWAWIASARPIPSMSCLSEWCRVLAQYPFGHGGLAGCVVLGERGDQWLDIH